MKILLMHGNGVISDGIMCFTRGDYSHAAFWMDNGDLWEAWQGSAKHLWKNSGVRRVAGGPKKGWDGIHVYELVNPATQKPEPLTPEEEQMLLEWLQSVEGTRYDFAGFFRFLTRSRKPSEYKMFCSDLIIMGMIHIGKPLFNLTTGDEVDPNLIKRSLRLVRSDLLK